MSQKIHEEKYRNRTKNSQNKEEERNRQNKKERKEKEKYLELITENTSTREAGCWVVAAEVVSEGGYNDGLLGRPSALLSLCVLWCLGFRRLFPSPLSSSFSLFFLFSSCSRFILLIVWAMIGLCLRFFFEWSWVFECAADGFVIDYTKWIFCCFLCGDSNAFLIMGKGSCLFILTKTFRARRT